MRNESINKQGVKLKNQKFWSGAEFSLAPKLMQTLSSTLNYVSETSSWIFSIANSLKNQVLSTYANDGK